MSAKEHTLWNGFIQGIQESHTLLTLIFFIVDSLFRGSENCFGEMYLC